MPSARFEKEGRGAEGGFDMSKFAFPLALETNGPYSHRLRGTLWPMGPIVNKPDSRCNTIPPKLL